MINRVVIVGGGSSGWMAAAMLGKLLGKQVSLTLVESDDIGTIGVGEATIPPIQLFNQFVGIDEATLLKATGATYKLGIQFENWGAEGERYMHAFGDIGRDIGLTRFIQYWLRAKAAGSADDFWDYCLNYQAAKNGQFAHLHQIPNTPLNGLVYAFHFDAARYAQLLRERAEQFGVSRIEGKVIDVVSDNQTGFIQQLVLSNGQRIDGDLFIDCSGFAGLLIDKTLGVKMQDWSHWLPSDRALAVQTPLQGEPLPYTRAIAHQAGWQWQIPLQHRMGNGLVFSSQYMDEQQGREVLAEQLGSEAAEQARLIRFQTGRREVQWRHNCIALGLSSGFLEPLESTSLHLVQSSLIRLIKLFPYHGIDPSAVKEFNQQAATEIEQIRDFVILHYHLNQRPEPFWRACAQMNIPDSLQQKLALFRTDGKVFRQQDELFSEIAWQQVMVGQGLIPEHYHILGDNLPDDQLQQLLKNMRDLIATTLRQLPTHQQFIQHIRH